MRIVGLIVVLVCIAGVAYFGYAQGWHTSWLGSGTSGTNGESPSDGNWEPTGVSAIGRIEPAGGVLQISALVGDQLERYADGVVEGAHVQAGSPLAYLASRDIRKLELEALDAKITEAEERAKAEENSAQSRVDIAQLAVESTANLDLEIAAQKKQVDALEAKLVLARKDAERLDGLPKSLISDQQRERQQLLIDTSEAELGAANAALAKLEKSRPMAEKQHQADLDAAQASLELVKASASLASLKKQRELAEEQLQRTVITAPTNGTVLQIFTHPGELISNRPLMQFADLSQLVIVAEVDENDVARLKIGQPARVDSRAFGDSKPLDGRVSMIGNLVQTPALKSLDPFARADMRVVQVYVELDPASAQRITPLINLQVDVTFLTEDK